MMKTLKKKTSFWNSELPLTSKRANFIFSNPEESKNLVKAIRASRSSNDDDDENIIKFSDPKTAERLLQMT